MDDKSNIYSSSFVVKLNGLKLSSDSEKKISAAISAAVFEELGDLDFKGDTVVARFPPILLGLWLQFRPDGPDLDQTFPVEEFN